MRCMVGFWENALQELATDETKTVVAFFGERLHFKAIDPFLGNMFLLGDRQ